MDMLEAEYNNYWETKMFYEELDSWGIDEALSNLYDSSSPEGPASPITTKNIATERNRRRKLNDKLYALRSVVPNITKIAEIAELEKHKEDKSSVSEITEEDDGEVRKRRKKRSRSSILANGSPGKPYIEDIQVRVSEMGEKVQVVSITCTKKKDTLFRVCELFESLNLKTTSANITSVCGLLSHTLFVESDDMNSVQLKEKIEAALSGYDAMSPISSLSF
ncbi:uncharacterized protein A4U43_C01F6350 [Asparagus officinalis]|uniref:BHLH domain-containing protein n=1 Tax=Asparagus officinalis TaxID=4686 RepID=A0A5P1FMA3_ASPOF|nr:uncharacterized protein A4U43_C01F6350 [Asparagus officinalis]